MPYTITSGVSSNVPTGSTTTKSLTIDMGNDTGRAFLISQAIINGSRYTQAMGSSVSGVNVYFPTQYGTNYVPLLKCRLDYYQEIIWIGMLFYMNMAIMFNMNMA